jgi:L,D-peptidoglycan transpeptidase YkuD (ErfK/YbiS/YcfS/YnhG family)
MFLALLIASVPAIFDGIEAEKIVLVRVPAWGSTQGVLERYERAPSWRRVGEGMRVVVGKKGIAREGGKVEGDLRTPSGIFRLIAATGYDPRPPAGMSLDYQQATAALKCVDDPKSKYYNRIVDETRVKKDWKSAEDMRLPDDRYRRVLVVDYNIEPTKPGKGSCIFIHPWKSSDAATAGCIALAGADMDVLFTWVDANTRVLVLPEQAIE